jgi:acyl-CoA reductase-like NAD-dependent aldehyde dehydrogenase
VCVHVCVCVCVCVRARAEKIAFTGSNATGARIMATCVSIHSRMLTYADVCRCAANTRPLILEL